VALSIQDQLLPLRSGPKERCGFVMKTGEVLELENVHPEPTLGFRISPAEVVKHCNEAAATWHTHEERAYPSGADFLTFVNWPNLVHYIVGSDGVRCYKVERTAVLEVHL
jgi:proteasome lid subunit RPN8/RPN11